jgi:glycosyltransferase involved in cell wall biosynthesis
VNINSKDHTGKQRPLNVLLERDGYTIVLLHDSTVILEKLFELSDAQERLVVILSWSWYVDDAKSIQLKKKIDALAEEFQQRGHSIRNNLLVCMNSLSELARYRAIDPDTRCILVNNACFLSTELMKAEDDLLNPEAPAVMNAKSWYFKRHYLTARLPNKTFIAYNENGDRQSPQYCDIRAFHPDAIHYDISPKAIAALNAASAFGLALSEIEGACYASAEYLLCGLPVISTPSLGGRDEFYDKRNSIIAHPSGDGLLRAAHLMREKIAARDFDRRAIRQNAINRIYEFRSQLCDEIENITGISSAEVKRHLDECCASDNKLLRRKNFWIKEILRGEG